VTDEELRERVAALEATVAELHDRLDRAINRDIPLLKGTIRAAIGTEIDDIGHLPDAGHAFNEWLAGYEERITPRGRPRCSVCGGVGLCRDGSRRLH